MAEAENFEAQLLAQMRNDFLSESQDILDRLGTLLVQLEQSGDPDLLRTIFREVHTLKGTAGFVGLDLIQSLAHKMENVFGALRDGQLAMTPNLIDAAFAGLQALTAMREDVLHGGKGESCKSNSALAEARLKAALETPRSSPPAPAVNAPAEPAQTVEAQPVSPAPVVGLGEQDKALDPAVEVQAVSPVPLATLATLAGQGEQDKTPAPAQAASTLRVPVETMDAMLELVGELITARNALVTAAEQSRDEQLLGIAALISRLTSDLQATVTSVRLVPVERLFSRFTGIVRNTARECGKQARLVIEGGDTPLDRTISEQMYDPLVHLLRNAVDHGLEPPAERRQRGKPEEGVIRLSAERRGDDVILRVADDGGGIDPARIRRVAVERGLYSTEEAAALPDEQVARLVFVTGFSTARQVTDLSGRGVGLDVVAQNVRRLRGRVDIESVPGQGTTFVIQLPLTLAVLQVQLVRVGGRIYAIPLHIVRETLQIAPGAIQTMQHGEVIFVHNVALPLRRLSDFGLETRAPVPTGDSADVADRGSAAQDPKSKVQNGIVVHLTGRDEAVVVDELVGKQQMVVKPLSPYLGAVKGIEGAAILPNGSVTLILGIEELMNGDERENVL